MRLRMLFPILIFVFGISYVTIAQIGKPKRPVEQPTETPMEKPTETPVEKPAGKEEVIRVETQLVDVPVAVVSANGMPVKGLKSSDFILTEDGKRQDIVEFSSIAEPFEVALLLDTSGSTRADLRLIQNAAQSFIASLRPGDRVAIIAYNTERRDDQLLAVDELVSPLTSDRILLRSLIDNIKTSNGTPYYDSLLQVVEKVFRDPPKEQFRGRRALVALTDGVDSTSSAGFLEAKEALSAAGIISFFIQVDTQEFVDAGMSGDCETSPIRFSAAQLRRYYSSLQIKAKSNMEKAVSFGQLGEFERLAVSKRLYEIADSEMNDLAKMSGGKVFPVGDLTEARNAFKSVADEIGTKYSLGYYSSNEKRDGTYRKIKIEVKNVPAGTQARFRQGYSAPGN
jgi:VWFA-related protein